MSQEVETAQHTTGGSLLFVSKKYLSLAITSVVKVCQSKFDKNSRELCNKKVVIYITHAKE